MLFNRSISDGLLEHHAHLERRNEQLESAFRVTVPTVTIDLDRTAYYQAIEQLGEVYEECSEVNWDGYGAVAITHATYKKAAEFLDAMPNRLPPPEVIPENDGELALEWRDHRGQSLSVSLSSNGRMTVLYGPERFRTTMYWTRPELPKPLLKLIELFV
jgi:hypothetical protein